MSIQRQVKMVLSDHVKKIIRERADKFLRLLSFQDHRFHEKKSQGQVKFDVIPKIRERCQELNKRQTRVKLQKKTLRRNKRKKIYRSYTAQFKYRTVRDIKALLIKSKLPLSKIIRLQSQRLQIAVKNIYRWYNMQKFQQRKCQSRNAKFPEMQKLLVQFIKTNPKVRRKFITQKAKQIMTTMYPQQLNSFSFSQGWFQKFKMRHKYLFPNFQTLLEKKELIFQMQSQMEGNQGILGQNQQMQVQFVEECHQIKDQPIQSRHQTTIAELIQEQKHLHFQTINDQSQSIIMSNQIVQEINSQFNNEDFINFYQINQENDGWNKIFKEQK